MEEKVVLVDENDIAIGEMGKMEAHRKGVLHRAISVFIFNRKGEMLLQQRASVKYHGALLWSNTCCSHPRPEEQPAAAASRRLREEMGISTLLEPMFSFTYRAEVENGLTENEFDHVFTGVYDGEVHPDPNEVQDYTYQSIHEIKAGIETSPGKYTQWFRIIFPDVEKWWHLRFTEF
jgi:isopentenyl-diphosphate Delta-isomerase